MNAAALAPGSQINISFRRASHSQRWTGSVLLSIRRVEIIYIYQWYLCVCRLAVTTFCAGTA